jgi:GNAT superfamily N-acetyltransferase
MTLPAFDRAWREKEWIKPEVCLLEVRDRDKLDGEAIARLFVQRQESYSRDGENGLIYEASIRLSYETIEPKHSPRFRDSGSFCGSYSRGFGEMGESVSLTGSAVFLDLSELCGQRIGTYLMNEIVTWAKQWPKAEVRPISLLRGQAGEENRARRNRFYERFGLEFEYSDSQQCEGVSKPICVEALTPVMSWEANIRERDPRDYFSELLYERERMVREASQQAMIIKSRSASLDEANTRPVRWAARRAWWRLYPLLVRSALLLAFAALAWMSFRSSVG